MTSLFRHFGGMCWPVPCERERDLEWRLRYARESLTESELLCAASILSAYRELVALPARKRGAIVRELRLGPSTPKPVVRRSIPGEETL